MDRVFVTGGTGFVGSHVVERLLDEGIEPICLVRETSDTDHLDGLGVETFVGSLTHVEGLRPALRDVDGVVHIAGVIKAKDFDWFYQINADATGELAKLALETNPDLERFVFISSVSAQGPSEGKTPRPLEETPAPVSHYGRSKLAGEKEVLKYSDNLPVTIFRPPPVYGPRDHEMLAAFKMARRGINAVYGSGDSLLSVVFIDDLVDAIYRSLVTDHPSGSIFPIDDGQIHSWRSLTGDIGRAMGKDPMTLPVPTPLFHAAAHASEAWGKIVDKAMIFTTDKVAEMSQDSWICGCGELEEALGWTPDWPLQKGAKVTAEWYIREGWI